MNVYRYFLVLCALFHLGSLPTLAQDSQPFSRFSQPQLQLAQFGYNQTWRTHAHVRTSADVNGDGLADIVGFANEGVFVSLNTGSGFTRMSRWHMSFSYYAGWRVESHPRMLADVNGDGMDDVVGFATDGVYVALSNGTSFGGMSRWIAYYGTRHSWYVDRNPRTMGDVNGDGLADVIGFGSNDVVVSLSTGSGFGTPKAWFRGFGYNQTWRVHAHPRMAADVDGDGRADVIGIANDGVHVALSTGTSFINRRLWAPRFGYNHTWRVYAHPRMAFDVNADGKADMIGFADAGVWVALSDGNTFTTYNCWINSYGQDSSWQVSAHPRVVDDINGDGAGDVIGFANGGVVTSIAESGLPGVTPNFSAGVTTGAAPLTVQFQDSSVGPKLYGISSWSWDFNGDGLTDSTLQHPEFTFLEPGSYDVSLTVTVGPGQETVTKPAYITVAPNSVDTEPPILTAIDLSYLADAQQFLGGISLNEQGTVTYTFSDWDTGETLDSFSVPTTQSDPYESLLDLQIDADWPRFLGVALVAQDEAGNLAAAINFVLDGDYDFHSGYQEIMEANTGVMTQLQGDLRLQVMGATDGRPMSNVLVGEEGGSQIVLHHLSGTQELSLCGVVGGCVFRDFEGELLLTTRETLPDGSVVYATAVQVAPSDNYRYVLGFDPALGGAGVQAAQDTTADVGVSAAGDVVQATVSYLSGSSEFEPSLVATITAGDTGGAVPVGFRIPADLDAELCGANGSCAIYDGDVALSTVRHDNGDGYIVYSSQALMGPEDVGIYQLAFEDREPPVIRWVVFDPAEVRSGEPIRIRTLVVDLGGDVIEVNCVFPVPGGDPIVIPLTADPSDPTVFEGTFTPPGDFPSGDVGPIIEAEDDSGNGGSDDAPIIRVDNDEPVIQHPPDGTPPTQTPRGERDGVPIAQPGDCVELAFDIFDVHTGIESAAVRITSDDGTFVELDLTFNPLTELYELTYCVPEGPGGGKRVDVIGRDRVGNPAEFRCKDFEVCNPPIASLSQDQTIQEGDSAQFVATVTDIDPNEELQFQWSFGDGTSQNGGTSVNHVYGDNGTYTVQFVVTDRCGFQDSATVAVTVENVEPSLAVDLTNTQMIGGQPTFVLARNAQTSFLANIQDPGSDDLSITWNWGDGSNNDHTIYYNNGSTPDGDSSPTGTYPFARVDQPSHAWARPGRYTLTVTVEDDDGAIVTQQFPVLVRGNVIDFVVLGTEGVHLSSRVDVQRGSVGVNGIAGPPYLAENAELTLDNHVSVTAPDTYIMANRIFLKDNARANLVYANQVLGEGIADQVLPAELPAIPNLPTVPSFTVGQDDIHVGKNKSINLTAGSYGHLSADRGASIRLSSGTYNFATWEIGQNVSILADGPVTIRIAGQMALDRNTTLAPSAGSGITAADLQVIVTGQNGQGGAINGKPAAAEVGNDSRLLANLYAPYGTLAIGNKVTAEGTFLGRWVTIGNQTTLNLRSGF